MKLSTHFCSQLGKNLSKNGISLGLFSTCGEPQQTAARQSCRHSENNGETLPLPVLSEDPGLSKRTQTITPVSVSVAIPGPFFAIFISSQHYQRPTEASHISASALFKAGFLSCNEMDPRSKVSHHRGDIKS